MRWIRAFLRELFGLVVDDVEFAASVIVWIGLVWLATAYAPKDAGWPPLLLFAGLGAILLHGTAKRARGPRG